MRNAAEIPPVDVSKGLFMDLAFLLIATLVLLIQEPAKSPEEAEGPKTTEQLAMASLPKSKIRSVAVKGVIEKDDIPGTSLYLQIQKDGKLGEILHDDTVKPIPTQQVENRIMRMDSEGGRVIVLMPDQSTPYAKVAAIRDILSLLKDRGDIAHIYEVVRKGQ